VFVFPCFWFGVGSSEVVLTIFQSQNRGRELMKLGDYQLIFVAVGLIGVLLIALLQLAALFLFLLESSFLTFSF
jgi:hypothetical protein